MEKLIALVYMVAGISSRFGGKIKQFAKVGPNSETLIEYSLKQALPAGFSKIIFIVGEKTEQPFKDLFGNFYHGNPIQYAFQYYDKQKRDKPWGTADALCSAEHLIKSPFIICNGDDLYGTKTFQILTNHLKNNSYCATIGYRLVEAIPNQGAVHRAIFQVDENYYVKNLKETFNIEKSSLHPDDYNKLCSMNIFALFPETIQKLNTRLELFKLLNKNHRTAECLLTNEISTLIKSNQIKMKFYQTSDKWLGITNPKDEEVVRGQLRSKYNHNL